MSLLTVDGREELDQRVPPRPVELGEPSTTADQFSGSPILNNSAIVDHEHPVGRLHG